MFGAMIVVYQCLLVLKFLSVMGFAGGCIAALGGLEVSARKHALHRIASPCLLATWLLGYALLALRGDPWFEFWVAGALVLSIVTNGVVSYAATRDVRGGRAWLGFGLPLAGIVVLMVMKPTWSALLP